MEDDLETLHNREVTVLVPAGPLDLTALGPLKRALADLIQHGRLKLVVDLLQVPYLESAALGAIVEAMKRARAAGGDVRLCGVQPEVRNVLLLTGLMTQIRVYGDRQEAVLWR